jgi:DNA-binding NarL/FixJ family response regulator
VNAREAALARDGLARERLAADPIYRIKLARENNHERPYFRITASAAQLTAREREVLQLAANGLRNKQIAAACGSSEQTVKSQLRSVCRKLGAQAPESRTRAVAIAIRRGLIE